MARYTGPTCRVARRLGTDLSLKSKARDLSSKCKLATPPGVHGQKRSRPTDYGLQCRAKQQIKATYGVLERQFRRYYFEAARRKGATGETLLILLELRLDNLVYRLGLGSTRAEARQLINHGAIMVNGKKVSIASYQVKVNDLIEVRERSKTQIRIVDSMKLAEGAGFPDYVQVDSSKFSGILKRLPERAELPAEFNEQLVVELYSK